MSPGPDPPNAPQKSSRTPPTPSAQQTAPGSPPAAPAAPRSVAVPIQSVTILLLLLALLVATGWLLSKDVFSSEVRLPLLAITGVIALLAALSFVSLAFAALDLSDKTQALALPEGSIRAVIALTLVVLFAIIGIFLYSRLSEGKLDSISGLSPSELADFRASPAIEVALVRTTPDSLFTVYYRQLHSPASDDFAKQLLTMIGTLVTSVASFYFGTRSSISAGQAALAQSPAPVTGPLPQPAPPTQAGTSGDQPPAAKAPEQEPGVKPDRQPAAPATGPSAQPRPATQEGTSADQTQATTTPEQEPGAKPQADDLAGG